MKKKVVKKRRGRKSKPANEADPGQRIKILSALTLYFATGSYNQVQKDLKVPRPTLARWLGQYTDLAEEAKKKAAERTEIRLTRIIDLTLDLQIKNLESKKGITPETLNRIMGTAIDKLCLVQGKPTSTGKMELGGKVEFTFGTKNLTSIIPDSKNRMSGLVN